MRKLVIQGFDNNACVTLAQCLQKDIYSNLVHVELVEGTRSRARGSLSADQNNRASTSSRLSMKRGPQAMAQLLEQNSSLKKLVLSYSHKGSLERCDVKVLARALSKNTALQHLDLRSRSSASNTMTVAEAGDFESLVRMFKQKGNETLTKLSTDAPEAVQTQIDFYTELNASGAPQLVRRPSAHHDEWMKLLVRQKEQQAKKAIIAKEKVLRVRTVGPPAKCAVSKTDDAADVSVLFHTLRQNPRFLLSYNPEQDPQANVRPAFLKACPTKVGPKRSKTTTQTTLRNLQRRRKPARAPSCFALNAPGNYG